MTAFCLYNWKSDKTKKNYGYTEYFQKAEEVREVLNSHSPTLCMAKWLQVSLNLTNGTTQSCYHPPPHPIPIQELKIDVSALHNTNFKKQERKQMLEGKRPDGCAYCWRVEDAGQGNHLSDRHYKSAESWARPHVDKIVQKNFDNNITPTYIEVNFNRACNFKCMYCSPHLSTTWEEEVKKFGPYKIGRFIHNDLGFLEKDGFMPIDAGTKENPYLKAFWEWWPNIYYNLRMFRMTGGEPLMDKNTFRVLEYVKQNPHPELEVSITSNMCPPDPRLFDKFLSAVKDLENLKLLNKNPLLHSEFDKDFQFIDKSFKHFWLYISLDSTDKHAEYIRNGLDYEILISNVKRFLTETKFTNISFINTFNILSIPNLKKFLQLILELRREFGGRIQQDKFLTFEVNKFELQHKLIPKKYKLRKSQRIHFDIPLLDYPNWFDPKSATSDMIKSIEDSIEFMKQNEQTDNYLETFEGFKPHEILKLKRNLEVIKQGLPPEQLLKNKIQFYNFVNEYDKRKEKQFLDIFPTLKNYYKDCKRLSKSITWKN